MSRHKHNHYITPGLEYTPEPKPAARFRQGILAQIESHDIKYEYNQLDEQMLKEHLDEMSKVVLYTGRQGMEDFKGAIKNYKL